MSKSMATRVATIQDYYVQTADCREVLQGLPDACIDLCVTSPPYFIGKKYDVGTTVSQFTKLMSEVLPQICRVLRKGGSLCVQTGYHIAGGAVTPLDCLIFPLMAAQTDFVLRNRVIWRFGHGLHCTLRFSGRHEVLLWYTKGGRYKFKLDDVRVPQKYPGKRYYKGPLKGQYSGNPRGKNPEDVWDIPNVKSNHPEKLAHPCQFPVALVDRLVKALCKRNAMVLDPFCGTGSAGVAALLNRCRFFGIEKSVRYSELARKRLAATIAGTVKVRPSDLPVHVPVGTEDVATTPSHFRFATKEIPTWHVNPSQRRNRKLFDIPA